MAATAPNSSTQQTKFVKFQSDIYDIGHLMRDAFLGEIDDHVSTRDILLAWILRIPDQTDPAIAAQNILNQYHSKSIYQDTSKQAELVKLLTELTQFNAQRISRFSKRRQRKNNLNSTQFSREHQLN